MSIQEPVAVSDTGTPNLNPADIEPPLSARSRRIPVDAGAVLPNDGQRTRDAPMDRVPSAGACRDAMPQAGQILAAR